MFIRNKSCCLLIILLLTSCSNKPQPGPWASSKLMAPAKLAEMLNKQDKDIPLILDIGPAGLIKNAVYIGETKEEKNLLRFKSICEKLQKNKPVIIYCGCCPFKDCPNIRPAFRLLKEAGFTNFQLLDITRNLKADWIDKGYPMKNK